MSMTENEAQRMLQAKLTCMELEMLSVDGTGCDDDCDNCKYCYAQGTVGEQREALNMAIQALEKQVPKEPIIIDNRFNEVEWKCPVCGLNVIEEPPCQEYCQRCGNKLDWSEE